MSLIFVLGLYAIVLAIISGVGALLLGTAAYLLTRRAASGRKRAIIMSACYPFFAAGYAGLWFVCYALISMLAFDKDPGLGDS